MFTDGVSLSSLDCVGMLWSQVLNSCSMENEFCRATGINYNQVIDNMNIDLILKAEENMMRMEFMLSFRPSLSGYGFDSVMDIKIRSHSNNEVTYKYFEENGNHSFAQCYFIWEFRIFKKMLREMLIKLPLPSCSFPCCGILIYSNEGMELKTPDGKSYKSLSYSRSI